MSHCGGEPTVYPMIGRDARWGWQINKSLVVGAKHELNIMCLHHRHCASKALVDVECASETIHRALSRPHDQSSVCRRLCQKPTCFALVMSANELERGNDLLQQGHAQQAAQVFQQILRDSGDDAQAHAGLGNALLQLGQDDQARSSLEKACRLNDRIAYAHSALAWLAPASRDRASARNSANRALALNPDDANSLFVLAQALTTEGRWNEAERAFQRCGPAYALHRRALRTWQRCVRPGVSSQGPRVTMARL